MYLENGFAQAGILISFFAVYTDFTESEWTAGRDMRVVCCTERK